MPARVQKWEAPFPNSDILGYINILGGLACVAGNSCNQSSIDHLSLGLYNYAVDIWPQTNEVVPATTYHTR